MQLLRAYLIRFLLVIRGTLMAAPSKLLPVMKIPLQTIGKHQGQQGQQGGGCDCEGSKVLRESRIADAQSHQAAPPTESPTQSPIPRLDQKYGEMFLNRKKR